VEANAQAVRAAGVPEFLQVAESLDQIAVELPALSADLEALEQRLTVLEQKLIAVARARQSEEQALETRKDLESHLRPWRSKMTAPQISMLETQFLDRATLAGAGLPRLSLFYLK
jgi:chromosome segregation ATPase